MEDTTRNLDTQTSERPDDKQGGSTSSEIKENGQNQSEISETEKIREDLKESNERYREEIVPAQKVKSKRGGKRANAGRPRKDIYTQKHTIASRKATVAMQMRVVRQTPALINSLVVLARGVSYLMRVEKIGGKLRSSIVKDKAEIIAYLDGELQDTETKTYHYITTEKPEINAINSLLDRTYGKPRQTIGLDGGAEGKPISVETYERAKRAIRSNLGE